MRFADCQGSVADGADLTSGKQEDGSLKVGASGSKSKT